MDFISYFTKNTRVSILLSLILLLFGFLGFRQLKSESIPSVDCGNGTLSNVQLVKGSVAIPFQKRSIGLETLLAARYYESGSHSVSQPGFASGALGGVGNVSFSVEKRVNPIAVRVYGNGVLDRVRNDNTGATEGSMALGSSSPKHFTVRSTSNLTSGVQYSFSWQVDADFPPN